jgi:hypothetical protein
MIEEVKMESEHRFCVKFRVKELFLGLFIAMIFSLPAFGFFGGKIESFSADMVFIGADGKEISTSKLYITPEAMRMDGLPMAGQHAGMNGMDKLTTLSFSEKNKEYIYNHDKKLFFEAELDEQEQDMVMNMMKRYEKVDQEQILGNEKVSGYNCTKKRVTTTVDMMGMKITSTETIWQSDQFDMPLRIEDEEGMITEYRNIDPTKPSAKLFQLPTGYKKVGNIMEVMGMDFSGMDMSGDVVAESPQQDIRDVDIEEFMAGMQALIGGENADPEQMAEMQQVFSQAMEQARQIDQKPGATDGMWNIIPKRSGDTLGSELKTPEMFNATLGSESSFKEVCEFYEKNLSAKGWQNTGSYIQDGQGFLQLAKEAQHLMISSADNPGLEGDFKCFYNLQLRTQE